jgi:hypothetical protein
MSPRRCLFGPPDPQETRVLLEDQLATDRRQFLVKYGYDIVTGRFVSSFCSLEERRVTASEDNFPQVPEPTGEGAEKRRCSPESQVRHRAGRYAPYDKQTRITGSHLVLYIC